MIGRLGYWAATGFLLGGTALGLASGCGESSSSRAENASGAGGVAHAGTSATAGSGTTAGSGGAGASGAPHAGSSTGGSAQGGFGGTRPVMTDGGVGGEGEGSGEGGRAGGGEPAGGVGGQRAEGGAGGESVQGGAGGAIQQCDTTAVAEPHAAACAVAPSVTQDYQVGLAGEQLSFGVRLRATGFFGLVHVNEIEVHYYYSQEETSGFQPTVESFVLQPAGVDLTASSEISIVELDPYQNSTSGPGCQTHFIRIRNTSPLELAPATQVDTYAEFHVTLTPNSAAPPNQNHTDDHSYVPDAVDWQQTSLLGVYHCGALTSGCTPGDAGTCDLTR